MFVPRVRGKGPRHVAEDVVVEASGLEARVIQHEVDHLDGVLRSSIAQPTRCARMPALREALDAA